MRKLIAVVALAAGLMLGSVSNAATVDLFLTQQGPGSGNWDLSVTNNGLAGGVGAINILVSGLTSVAYAAVPGLDTALSSLTENPLEDGIHNFLILQNTAAGVSIVNQGATVLLATLSGLNAGCSAPGENSNRAAGAGCVGMSMSENLIGSPTVFAASGVGIDSSEFSITVNPFVVVPEPASVVLLGLGLAALGFVRRSA